MIIFGSRGVHLKTAQLKSCTCPNCDSKGSLHGSIYRRHAHIFWIPLFPFGKKGYTTCLHCKQVLKPNEMPEEIKDEYHVLKKSAKSPIWQYAGLLFAFGLIMAIVVATIEDKKAQELYKENPEAGDVYRYKTETGNYSTLKVMKVGSDSVFVSDNELETDKKKGVRKINKDENYTSNVHGISKDELKQLFEEKIYRIDR